VLREALETQHGIVLVVNEVYRPEPRQQWLYGAGRPAELLLSRNIPIEWARPTEPIVTNAWSAATSAHGYTLVPPYTGETPPALLPAACALDVVPVGADGRPWTVDDRWDEFVQRVAEIGSRIGLIHFHAPGKAVWDKPHLQLVEWSDTQHTLLPPARPVT
jgi:hypothetical protein